MEKKGILQEWLKAIACVTMLIDHIGAVFFLGDGYRIIGRLAFPIYCFLLVEGFAHTRDYKRYGLRLLIGAVLAELPFDYLFYGGLTWASQSAMVTLSLGLLMLMWAKKRKNYILPFAVCFFAAEFLNANYGGWGVALVALFGITADMPHKWLLQTVGMAFIFYFMGSYGINLGIIRVPVQMFGLMAMIPIMLYSGRKAGNNKAVQWGFYLFYPVHMLVLLLIKLI